MKMAKELSAGEIEADMVWPVLTKSMNLPDSTRGGTKSKWSSVVVIAWIFAVNAFEVDAVSRGNIIT